jgi:hypothetical protein
MWFSIPISWVQNLKIVFISKQHSSEFLAFGVWFLVVESPRDALGVKEGVC